MNRLLRKCRNCQAYTLKATCPKCGSDTASPHPPRFSPDDRYLRYRVQSRYGIKETKGEAQSSQKETTAAK
ncbi:MAG: RNA-protein complex protein Nop10 [Nitrososphaerota archaeon]|nr:RNA-protein complex protein Nop10 [Nitrososphaerota archaeon]